MFSGRVACEITSADALVTTELVFDGLFKELPPDLCVAVVASLTERVGSAGKEPKDIKMSVECKEAYEKVRLFLFSDCLPILTFCFIQTARDAQEVRQSRQNQADTGSTMTAFQLRNRDMHTFEARQQAWRGTSREYADAGGR